MTNKFKQAFLKAQKYWENNDYKNARYWYEIAMKSEEFKDKSLSKLLQIEIREGKYAIARRIMNENKDISSSALMQAYGLLENTENNFEESKKYYNLCMTDPNMQYKSLLALAKLHIQTGDYSIAEKILQTLQLNPNYYIQATFALVSLNIYQNNFFEARKNLYGIDSTKLTPKVLKHYQIISTYIKYYLGELKQDSCHKNINEYAFDRLFHKSDNALIQHINSHKNQTERYTNGCFLPQLDIKY